MMSEATTPTQAEVARETLAHILELMSFPAPIEITVTETEEQLELALSCEESLGQLIGKGGQTLNALELLVTTITRHKTGEYGKRLILDAEGYRTRQLERLAEIAHQAAARALETGEIIHMDPMNSRDRRIVHMALLEVNGISSGSQDEDPYRHIVITPLPADQQ